MYYGYDMQREQVNNFNTQYQTMVDPFVIQTLQTVIGKQLVVETTKDTIRGVLKDVKPDHVMLMAGNSPFFVRIQQIVSIMPID
jgi:ferredoxin-fold anticodon binding domain-containing protein